MHLEFDYLSRQNIPVKPTTESHDNALQQTLLDLNRSTLLVEGEDLGICYLPRDQNTPCLFRATLSPYPTEAYFLINTINHTPDSPPQSSWTLYFNVHSNQPQTPSVIELPLSWVPDVEQALEGKKLTTLSSEDKLHIQELLNLQKKEQLALNLFNRGFYTLFEKNDFTPEEKTLFLNFLQENANHSSFSFIDAGYFFDKKRQAGFHFIHSDNTSYKQNYRAMTKCSLILSSIEPFVENLNAFSPDFDCAYVFYKNKLYFIDKNLNQCTLLFLAEQALNELSQALDYDSLIPNQSKKLSLKELKAIKLITSHSFDYTPVIELVFHAEYDHCEADSTFSSFTDSTYVMRQLEKEIISDKMPAFFIAQTCLNDIIEHLADYSSEAKIRLDSCCTAEDKPDLESSYNSLIALEKQLRILSQQLDTLTLLVKTSHFCNEYIDIQADILFSYREKMTDLFKSKLNLLPQAIREIEDLTQPIFTTSFSDIYNIHPYRKALLQASADCIDEFNALLDTFLSDKTLNDALIDEMKKKLLGKITLADLDSSSFKPDFNSIAETDMRETQATYFTRIKNKLITLLKKREQFKKTFTLLIEKMELIKETTSRNTPTFKVMQHFSTNMHTQYQLKTSRQVNYLFETTFHLTPDQNRIEPTLASKKMCITSKQTCIKRHYLDAFQEEISNELRNKLLQTPSFDEAVNDCTYYELFKLITFSDLAFFSTEQQCYLLNRFITLSPDKRKSSSNSALYDSSYNHAEHGYSVFHLNNCIALTTELLKEILLANKSILTEIHIENCSNIDDESIALFSNKKLCLKKITLDNLPNVRHIEIKRIETLTHLTIKNCPALADLTIRSSCTALKQDGLDLKKLPDLKNVFFKMSKLGNSIRPFCKAIHKEQYNVADKAFNLIKSLKELSSVTLIYALGTWGLSENEENPERRILNAIRLLLCVTNAYKEFTDPFLAKLESKLSSIPNLPQPDEVYPKMMTRITNMSGASYPPDAFLELLKYAGRSRSSATLFDFRDVNIIDYRLQIGEMIDYLKSFLTRDESPNTLLEEVLARCDTGIPNETFFLSSPTEFDPTQPTLFHLLVTPEQKKMVETMCVKQIEKMEALEVSSPSSTEFELRSPLSPSLSQAVSNKPSEEDEESPLEKSGSSAGSSNSSVLNAPPHTVLFPSSQPIPILPKALSDLIVQKESPSPQ